MKKIDVDTKLLEGDKVYAPKLNKYFQIVDSDFKEIYKEIILNLEPTNKNSRDSGFTIRLSSLISLNYHIIS